VVRENMAVPERKRDIVADRKRVGVRWQDRRPHHPEAVDTWDTGDSLLLTVEDLDSESGAVSASLPLLQLIPSLLPRPRPLRPLLLRTSTTKMTMRIYSRPNLARRVER